jgi:lysophospholipase L1-like esterase
LRDAGYDVDFVGSLTHPTTDDCESYGVPVDFDRNHEGHDNKTAAEMSVEIDAILENHPADVILMHVGTNDLRSATNGSIPNIVDHVREILDRVNEFEITHGREVTVLLALITNQNPINALVTKFNDQLAQMAKVRIDEDDKIIVVDMENGAGLDYPNELIDTWHPNAEGYAKMADLWYQHLVYFLPSP